MLQIKFRKNEIFYSGFAETEAIRSFEHFLASDDQKDSHFPFPVSLD